MIIQLTLECQQHSWFLRSCGHKPRNTAAWWCHVTPPVPVRPLRLSPSPEDTEGNRGNALPSSNQPHRGERWSGWEGSVVVFGSLGLIMTLKCSFSSDRSTLQPNMAFSFTRGWRARLPKEEERVKMGWCKHLSEGRMTQSQQRPNNPQKYINTPLSFIQNTKIRDFTGLACWPTSLPSFQKAHSHIQNFKKSKNLGIKFKSEHISGFRFFRIELCRCANLKWSLQFLPLC